MGVISVLLDNIRKLNYIDILNTVKSFISLDISVNSTGWVRKQNGTMTHGVYKLKATENRERRIEFNEFLKTLVNNGSYDFIALEDVIGGCNFSTNRSLTELNLGIETLMDYNLIPLSPVLRIGNNTWKKQLRTVCQDNLGLKGSNDKEEIRFILNSLNFNLDLAQDVYDAYGIAIGAILLNKNSNSANLDSASQTVKLKEDIRKNYKITQFKSEEDMLNTAKKTYARAKVKKELCIIKYTGEYKNLLDNFKAVVREVGDKKLFCISYPLSKINAITLTSGFDITNDVVFFTAVLR